MLSLFSSSRDDVVVKSQRVEDAEYIIDASVLSPGEYTVRVAVVLGDEESMVNGEGDATEATSLMTVSGEFNSHTSSHTLATIRGTLFTVVVF